MVRWWRWCGAVVGMTIVVPPAATGQCPDGSPPPCAHVSSVASRSVAVLTFENLTRDTASDYLADGLSEAIYTRLRQVERLTLTSRTMVRRLRGADTLMPAGLGRALAAAYLVNGTVRADEGRLRVSVECVRAVDGRSVWAQEFDRPRTDLLTIEADIALAVASEVAGHLERGTLRVLTVRPTTNPTAYDLFYRGNHDLAQRTEVSLVRALREYASAYRLDPRFTTALAREAYTYGVCLDWGWRCGEAAETLAVRGRTLAERAVHLAPTLSDSWMAKGYMLYNRYAGMAAPTADTMRAALDAFRRSVLLDSTNAEGWHQYGSVLLIVDHARARAAYRRALALDPVRSVSLMELAMLELAERRQETAELLTDSLLGLEPGFSGGLWMRARIRRGRGDTAGALLDARAAGADWLVAGITRDSALVAGDCMGPATVWGQLNCLGLAGWKEAVLTKVEAAPPSALLLWMLLQPELDALRGEPRFERAYEAARRAADQVNESSGKRESR